MFRLKYFILTVSIFYLSIASSLPTALDDDTDFLSTSPSHLDAVEQSQDWNDGIKPGGWIIASKATDVQPSTNSAGVNSIATQFMDDQEQAPEQFISVKPSSDTSVCLGAGGKGLLAPVRELLAPLQDLFRGPDRCKVQDEPRVAPDKGNDGPNCPNGKDLFCCDNPGFTQVDTQNGGHMRGECDISNPLQSFEFQCDKIRPNGNKGVAACCLKKKKNVIIDELNGNQIIRMSKQLGCVDPIPPQMWHMKSESP